MSIINQIKSIKSLSLSLKLPLSFSEVFSHSFWLPFSQWTNGRYILLHMPLLLSGYQPIKAFYSVFSQALFCRLVRFGVGSSVRWPRLDRLYQLWANPDVFFFSANSSTISLRLSFCLKYFLSLFLSLSFSFELNPHYSVGNPKPSLPPSVDLYANFPLMLSASHT